MNIISYTVIGNSKKYIYVIAEIHQNVKIFITSKQYGIFLKPPKIVQQIKNPIKNKTLYKINKIPASNIK